jgi:hypothetical protein
VSASTADRRRFVIVGSSGRQFVLRIFARCRVCEPLRYLDCQLALLAQRLAGKRASAMLPDNVDGSKSVVKRQIHRFRICCERPAASKSLRHFICMHHNNADKGKRSSESVLDPMQSFSDPATADRLLGAEIFLATSRDVRVWLRPRHQRKYRSKTGSL